MTVGCRLRALGVILVVLACAGAGQTDWYPTETTWVPESYIDRVPQDADTEAVATVSDGFTQSTAKAGWCPLHTTHYAKAFSQCHGTRTICCDDSSPEVEATSSVTGSTSWEVGMTSQTQTVVSDGKVTLYLADASPKQSHFYCSTFPNGPDSRPFSLSISNHIVHDGDSTTVYYRSVAQADHGYIEAEPEGFGWRSVAGSQPNLDFRE